MSTLTNVAVLSYEVVFSFSLEDTEAAAVVLANWFRPSTIYTKVEAPGLAVIESIFFGECPNSELLSPVDAWEFSIVNLQARQKEFLEKYGLQEKSLDEIQRYIDKHHLVYPHMLQLDFPTLQKDTKIRVRGTSKIRWSLSLVGLSITA